MHERDVKKFEKCILLAYDFERVLEMNCSLGENPIETVEKAKMFCKNNYECIGVFQKNCDDDKSYECLKNATSSSDVQINGCLYKKFAIGTWFLKCFLNIQYQHITKNMHVCFLLHLHY